MADDYREWMTRNGITEFTQTETDSPYGELVEFRAHRDEIIAWYAIPRDEFLDAKAPVMPTVLARLLEALDYSRPDYKGTLPPTLGGFRRPVHQ